MKHGRNRAIVWQHPIATSLVSTGCQWSPVPLPSDLLASDCYGTFVYQGLLHMLFLSSWMNDKKRRLEDGITIWCQKPDGPKRKTMKCVAHLAAFRWHFGLALCHHHIVMVGGWEISRPVSKVSAFNLSTQTWEDWPDLPEPLTGPVALAMRKGLIVVGGFCQHSKPNRHVYFLPLTKSPRQWQMNVVPDTLLGACGAAIFEGRLLVAGGQDAVGRIGRTVSVLDEESGSWLQLPNLLKPRCSPVVAILENRVLCIAGRTNTKVRTCVEELDLSGWPIY